MERLGVEALAVVVMNFDSEIINEYDDIVSALFGKIWYTYAPKNMDFDLKNKVILLVKLFIEKSPILDLKALSSYL